MGKITPQETELLSWLVSAMRSRLGEGWLVSQALEPVAWFGWEEAPAAEALRGPYRRAPDATLTITAPDGQRVVLLVEAKQTASPRAVEQAASLGGGSVRQAPEAVRMLVAPYLGPRVREACKARGVAYADQTGAWRLQTVRPSIDWEVGGAARNPAPEGRGVSSLLGTSTARVLRALVDTSPPYTLTELAATARVTPATAYKVVTLLEGEGILTRVRRGRIESVDWQGLLQRWAQEYKFERQNSVTPCLAARGPQTVMAKLRGQVAASTIPGSRWALTGAWAARSEFDSLADARLVIYAEQPAPLQELLDLKPWKGPGSNAAVVLPRDSRLFEEAVERDGVRCVPWSQVAIDLLGGRDRDPSAGENLLAWMSVNESRWRTRLGAAKDER